MAGLPTLNAKLPLGEALRLIDESIAKQQHTIDELLAPLLALKSQRNDFVPISCLPPEIMCRIFSLAQVPHPTGPTVYTVYKPLEWINLTYVCYHWRNIAVNSPSLWVAPPIGNRKWVDEMLRRSKRSSLLIKSNIDRIDSGIVPALRQIHRIEELSLRHFSSDAWNSIREMLPKSVPRLERLCLQGLEPDMGFGPTGPGPLVIWEDILCETERLRQLELDNCQLNWNSHSHLLRSLTHLNLKNLSQGSLPTGKQFANALKSMPDLEVLALWNSLPLQAEQQSTWGSQNTHLPLLRSLSINSVYVEVEAFLRCVTFPPTAIVKLICHDDGVYPDFSGVIFALARSYADTTLNSTFHSLKQCRAKPEAIRLLFSREAFKFNEIASTNTIAHLDLTMYFRDSDLPVTRKLMIDVFNSGIPLHDINCVYLRENMPEFDIETIANTLGRLPRLHSVMASGYGARPFFNAMHLGVHVEDATRSGETPIQELYFPLVSSIGLYNITFVDEDMLGTPEHSDKLSIGLLQNFFIQRCELGVPIETLLLRYCLGVFEEDLELLEEIVVNVDWEQEIVDQY